MEDWFGIAKDITRRHFGNTPEPDTIPKHIECSVCHYEWDAVGDFEYEYYPETGEHMLLARCPLCGATMPGKK